MNILQPITVKNMIFKNRVVMAPMIPFGLSTGDGTMGDELLQHYFKRATANIGLMISQAHSVTSSQPLDGIGAYSDIQISDLKKIADACHKNSTKFFVQLAYPQFDFNAGDTIDNLTITELQKIEDEFIYSAKICFKAGCDGVELHGAHGYFLNMLSSPLSNKRSDQYGGDLEGRLKLVSNIVNGIKEFSDKNFIISYRMGWNDTLEKDIETAKMLEKIGIEMLHVSIGIPVDRKLEIPNGFAYNEVVYTGVQVKKNVNIPVIVVNDIETLQNGDALIENDLCDFVGYGKPFLADENFVVKSLTNSNYRPCLKCKNCQWFSDGKKCPIQIKMKKQNIL